MYSHCYANVALVDQMRELIVKTHQLENVVTIANPINTQEIHEKRKKNKLHLIIVSLLDSLKTR
jgi:N-acetylgalactosamine-N,N'-diacetylbacillosaminyl-diphospho-undecaprenol 4-alpha-N-acetylgalactosaminyltransferase